MTTKQITQAEFDALEIGTSGNRVCPGFTDYSLVRSFGEWCAFGERCAFGKRCIAISPYWSFMYEPPMKTVGKILPTESCRQFWEAKLGVDLKGCYDDISSIVAPLLDDFLKRDDLSACERRIAESWRDKP